MNKYIMAKSELRFVTVNKNILNSVLCTEFNDKFMKKLAIIFPVTLYYFSSFKCPSFLIFKLQNVQNSR